MNNNERALGLHIRIDQSLCAALQDAAPLPLTALQFFLFRHQENKYLRINQEEQLNYFEAKKKYKNIYAHSSYWINLAHGNRESNRIAERLLNKELNIAEKLELNGLIIHPGSYKGQPKTTDDPDGRQASLEQIARLLNRLFKKKLQVPLIFENTAHKKKTIGSDFQDFYDLKKLLDKPEKLLFCIDFAHAHAFGYDLTATENFIDLLKKTVGIESIELLHVHDSVEENGSCHDRHALIGEGTIGIESLKNLVSHHTLIHKPIILELPKTNTEKSIEMINLVRSWKENI